VEGGVTAPVLLYKTQPDYTEEARKARYQGTVLLYIEVDPSGHATNIRVQRSLGLGLDEKAIEAVRQWKFKPGTRDGNPVTVSATIEVNFRLLDTPPAEVLDVIVGSVPATAAISPATIPPTWVGRTVKGINVYGLSEQARADLLSQLPMHEGDTLSLESFQNVARVVQVFDEHLKVGFAQVGRSEVTLAIAPAAGVHPVTGTAPAVSASTDGTPPARIRIGGNVQQTKLVSQPPAMYPLEAKQARIQGVVKLNATIAKDGTMQHLEVISGHPLLIPAALEAVKQWVYEPTLLNKQPVEVQTEIDVNFTLSQ
jgi:TonB family protein